MPQSPTGIPLLGSGIPQSPSGIPLLNSGLAPWLTQATGGLPQRSSMVQPSATPWYMPQMQAREQAMIPLVEMARQRRLAEELRKLQEKELARNFLSQNRPGTGGDGGEGDGGPGDNGSDDGGDSN